MHEGFRPLRMGGFDSQCVCTVTVDYMILGEQLMSWTPLNSIPYFPTCALCDLGKLLHLSEPQATDLENEGAYSPLQGLF